MNTITRERLEWITQISSRDEIDDIGGDEIRELARIALATRDAKPVAWTDEQELRDVENSGSGYLFTVNPITQYADPFRVIKLFTVPPAPVVPDEKPMPNPLKMYAVDAVAAISEVRGWNACRAAMLQGEAEQPQNSQQNIPKNIPEGYALVPIEPTESMIVDGFESEPDKFFSKPEEWKAYEAMSGCQQAAHRAKLCWSAMLAAAPKPE
jgi:hypothetical protein